MTAKSPGGIHLVGAAALIAQAEERGRAQAQAHDAGMTRDSIRVATAMIMIKQFREQCQGVPQGDPARTVVELMLESFEGVLTK